MNNKKCKNCGNKIPKSREKEQTCSINCQILINAAWEDARVLDWDNPERNRLLDWG